MPNSHIIEHDDPRALDPSIVGSKAASVADLIGIGTTVPPGFSIHASAFSEFTRPIADHIAKILKTVDVDNVSSSFEASDSIGRLLATLDLPAGLAANVTMGLNSSSGTFAVRSSATAEDLDDASFAGMYDSFLDATDAESVLVRIRDVWASYYTGRAISYRQRMGIPHNSGQMAVLVMELIDADAGGVVFTRDPRDGTDHIIVNAALGLGEGVVSGRATSDSFTLDSDSFEITRRDVLDKEWMFVSGQDGSTDRVPVPAAKRSKPALTDSQLLGVAMAASAIKKAAGNDRDIEFAVKEDTVHILQSRPVTTGMNPDSEFPVEWDDPAEAELHWTPVFGFSASSRVPTLPLYIDYLLISAGSQKRSIDYASSNQARSYLKKIVNGYMYAAEPVHDEEEWRGRFIAHQRKGLRYLNKGTTYYKKVVEPTLRKRLDELDRLRPLDDAPLADHVTNLRATKQTAADHQTDLHWRGAGGFGERGVRLKTLFAEITGRPGMESAELTRGLNHMTSRLVTRLMSLAALVKSDPWLTEAFEKRNYDAIFKSGSGKRPVVRKFRSRFRLLLKTWGRRNGIGYGSAWLPTDPTWNMKPEIPLDSIGSFIRQDLDALSRAQVDSQRIRKATIRSVRKSIGTDKKLRKQFDFELFLETQRVEFMENHNYLIEQCSFGEYRDSINRLGVALVTGGWIDTPDDVFFLRLAQLESAADSGDYSQLHSLVVQAQAESAENAKLMPPEFLGAKPPERPGKQADDGDQPLRGLSEDGSTLHGEPSSPGAFTGTARVVISRTSRPPDVKKGDILVADNAGPDWVPVFPLLGALVLDSGDNFQHASLICREYGIPCVIQTQVATGQIADGQVVSVDGSAGTIQLHPVLWYDQTHLPSEGVRRRRQSQPRPLHPARQK
jgi:phosphohistidine swiveling domain-containing protein